MKVTRNYLKRIIRESISSIHEEEEDPVIAALNSITDEQARIIAIDAVTAAEQQGKQQQINAFINMLNKQSDHNVTNIQNMIKQTLLQQQTSENKLRITKSYLTRVIKEELKKELKKEGLSDIVGKVKGAFGFGKKKPVKKSANLPSDQVQDILIRLNDHLDGYRSDEIKEGIYDFFESYSKRHGDVDLGGQDRAIQSFIQNTNLENIKKIDYTKFYSAFLDGQHKAHSDVTSRRKSSERDDAARNFEKDMYDKAKSASNAEYERRAQYDRGGLKHGLEDYNQSPIASRKYY